MYAKKRRYTPLIIVLLVLLLAGTTGTTVAKYVHSTQLEGKVKFTAQLAQSITLLESKAVRDSNGAYTLNKSVPVYENEYDLIPGLDIPKDPYITITGKTPIKAYLFVEVYHAIGNDYITFEIADQWKLVDNLTGKGKGGAVYVYTGGGNSPMALDHTNCPTEPIYILKDNKVYVGQNLLSDETEDEHLDFYACLSEIPTATTDLITIYQNAYQLQTD